MLLAVKIMSGKNKAKDVEKKTAGVYRSMIYPGEPEIVEKTVKSLTTKFSARFSFVSN
jgi:hypothetical protein